MLNEEKIKTMTKLAIYEKNDGKNHIRMSKYYQSDYVGINMIVTSITASLGFVLLLLLFLFYQADDFVENLTTINLFGWGRNILFLYLAFLAFYIVISYFIYSFKYKKALKNIKEYFYNLKELQRYNQLESKIKEELGGPFQDDDFT